MTINDFRGQVKISDIQEAFDEIVGRINNAVDIYNAAAEAEDIDYTKGSSKLSATDYTLTVGGLKTVLNGYNGTLIGTNVFKIDNTTCLITDGLYITSNEVYRIKSKYISGQSDWDLSELYYDIDNETVMFKDGANQSIVEVNTSWTQPTINSNTDCGVFTASSNGQDAYKITTSSGFDASWNGSGSFAYPTVVWNFPKQIKVSSISLNASATIFLSGDATIVVECDNQEIYRGGVGNINISLDNRPTSSLRIYAIIPNDVFGFTTNFNSLLVTGNASSYAIDTGETITPSDNIIKICDLNWNGKDGLIKDIKELKLENLKDYKMQDSNRTFTYDHLCQDTLNTSSSGQFCTYEFLNGNGSRNSEIKIFNKQVEVSPALNSDKHDFTISFYPKLYIPKGATDYFQSSGLAFRMITNPSLKRKS